MSSRRVKKESPAPDGRSDLLTRRSKRSWSRAILSNVLRLSIWFSIITVLFRCPPTPEEISPESPRICRPYFQGRDVVSPHMKPYYDAYAAKYVDRARPQADRLYENVYVPSSQFAKTNYEQYGAPRVEQARFYSQQEWERSLRPQLDKVQHKFVEFYQTSVEPHVERVFVVFGPYYNQVKDVAQTQYTAVILPTYEKARPYALSAYSQGARFTTDVGLPYGRWAAANAVTFIQRRVWPPIRVLYGENVQPQLIKIRERLANYRDSKSIEAAANAEDKAISSSSSFASDIASSQSVVSWKSTASLTTSISTTANSSPSQPTRLASTAAPDNILDDLTVWKNKFTRAAEEGAEGLRERIAEISNRQISDQTHGTGEALVTSLEETAKSAISALRSDIISIISPFTSSEEEPTSGDMEAAKTQARDAIRTAGKKVKDDAQKLRAWRRSYNEDLQQLIDMSADSTLDVVDSIREAGLQEIGMRWASMDGVTYKDWSEYHALRKSFDEWRETLKIVVSEHEAPIRARHEAEQVESRGMAVAEDAAKELSRLKDVANWKIEAHDASEDFSTRYSPPSAARAAQKVMKKAESVAHGESSQGIAESFTSKVGEAAESISQRAEHATSDVVKRVSSAASPAVDQAGHAASAVSARASVATGSVASSGSSISSSMASSASSAIEAVAESASSLSPSASPKAASMSDSLASSGSSLLSSASSKASLASRSVSASGSTILSSESSEDSLESSSLSPDLDSTSSAAAHRASSISSRAAASKSALADDAGVTPQYGVPPDTGYGRSKIEEDRKKYSSQRLAATVAAEMSKAASRDAAGTIVPGSSAEDTVIPIASVSASIASLVNAAGSDYDSVTSSVDRAEKMRSSVSAADG